MRAQSLQHLAQGAPRLDIYGITAGGADNCGHLAAYYLQATDPYLDRLEYSRRPLSR
jgi:hypothetical protein